VCGIDTYPNVWEGGWEKQASNLAEQTPAKAHGNAPADLPGPPPSPLILENGSIGLILTLPKFHLASLKLDQDKGPT